MNVKREKRILKELKELHESRDLLKQSGIYIDYNEDDINTVRALLIGPEKTPYEKGFYLFEFIYPAKYPMQPPLARFATQGQIGSTHIRFNPNLYTCGKVCLSLLNTWNGPGWVPTNTISNVLISIQALVLIDEPLRNEPGFENEPKESKRISNYSEMIEFANIKIAVLDMIFNHPSEFIAFQPIMKEIFLQNVDYYIRFVESKDDNKINENFQKNNPYSMYLNVNFKEMKNKIEDIKRRILECDEEIDT